MAARVAEALACCVERVRIVLRPDGESPIDLARIDDRLGIRAPIAGLHAALSCCEASGVLVAPCDAPEIEPRLVLALLALAPCTDSVDAVVPFGTEGPEPLLAIYRPSALPTIERCVERGDLSLRVLLESLRVRSIPVEALRPFDPDLHSFRNVNRPEDLASN
jgi:molybdopterin-guanine dinucleotide biosynthesis protein A